MTLNIVLYLPYNSSVSSSTPPPAQLGKNHDQYQDELIKLTIADLSFYYGIGEKTRRVK